MQRANAPWPAGPHLSNCGPTERACAFCAQIAPLCAVNPPRAVARVRRRAWQDWRPSSAAALQNRAPLCGPVTGRHGLRHCQTAGAPGAPAHSHRMDVVARRPTPAEQRVPSVSAAVKRPLSRQAHRLAQLLVPRPATAPGAGQSRCCSGRSGARRFSAFGVKPGTDRPTACGGHLAAEKRAAVVTVASLRRGKAPVSPPADR